VAASREWRRRGHGSPAELLAEITGGSLGSARGELETAKTANHTAQAAYGQPRRPPPPGQRPADPHHRHARPAHTARTSRPVRRLRRL